MREELKEPVLAERESLKKISKNDKIVIPAMLHPGFRSQLAVQNGVERKLLFKCWGGIGDIICAEPTLRYALKMFKNCEISLASEHPELFSHLPFHEVFDISSMKAGRLPNFDDYLVFQTITPPDESNMVWLFFSHMLTNCVDFPSLCALRLQLPVKDKEIFLDPPDPSTALVAEALGGVIVHPGRHWQSKTFPKAFWDRVLAGLLSNGIRPVIIGGNADDNRGTVDVNTEGCLDLRNKLSLTDSAWLLQRSSVLLTNDSSPLHMAASGGKCWIGYIATAKHPDLITHWRNGQWQWREKNFGRGGIWDIVDFCPNKKEQVEAEFVPPEMLESWLPNPYEYANWAAEKYEEMKYE